MKAHNKEDASSAKGQITQQELNALLLEHKKWLDDDVTGKQLVLTDFDLNGLKLTGALSQAQFTDCDLSYCEFKDCDLSKARFEKCTLVGVGLKSCEIPEALFSECDLSQCEVNGLSASKTLIVNDCDLSKSILQNVTMLNADFKLVRFDDAILKNVKFMGNGTLTAFFNRISIFNSSFTNYDLVFYAFTNATLSTVFFDRARINFVSPAIDTDFTNKVYMKDVSLDGQFINCNLIEMDFRKNDDQGSVFDRVSFTRCQLDKARFDHAVMGNATFKECQLAEAQMSDAILNNATFEQCQMGKAVISQAEFRFGKMIDCDARDLKASEISAYSAEFTDSRIFPSEFFNAHLSKADFERADIRGGFFEFADLSGANLKDAAIDKASFAGANLNGATYVDGVVCRIGSIGHCRKLPGN